MTDQTRNEDITTENNGYQHNNKTLSKEMDKTFGQNAWNPNPEAALSVQTGFKPCNNKSTIIYWIRDATDDNSL